MIPQIAEISGPIPEYWNILYWYRKPRKTKSKKYKGQGQGQAYGAWVKSMYYICMCEVTEPGQEDEYEWKESQGQFLISVGTGCQNHGDVEG